MFNSFMLYYIPLAVIVICFAVIIFVIARKLPQTANLDVENLQEEMELKKKEEIIAKRVEEEGRKLKAGWVRRFAPVKKIWGKLQLKFRIYVGKVERLWYHEESLKKKEKAGRMAPREKKQEIDFLLQSGEESLKAGDLEKAEDYFISAIKLDVKSSPAYRGLADTYLAKNSLEEAVQTYLFLLQLCPHDDAVMAKLAEIFEGKNDLEKAIEYYQKAVLENDSLSPRFYHLSELLLKIKQPETAKEAIVQAVELEPKNPKYLDLMIEIAIICGDKPLAERGYDELRLVNPENQKLVEIKERIGKI